MTRGQDPRPAVCFRDGAPQDAAAIAAFFASAFTDTFGYLYPPEDLAEFLRPMDADSFLGELTDPQHSFRLAMHGDALVGLCKLGPPSLPFDAEGRRAIELRQLYLAPSQHGTGVAHTLMNWALESAREHGFEDIYLSVFIDNHRARRFYERYGFVEVGLYAFKVGNTIDDDRVMKLTL